VANRLLIVAVLVLVPLNVGLFVAVLTQDNGPSDGQNTIAAHRTSARTSPSSAAASPHSTHSAAASPHSTHSAAASPHRTHSASSTSRSETSAPSPLADTIVLTKNAYVARPFEGVRVTGVWRTSGLGVRRAVHLEVRRRTGWSRFPLPAVTDASGRFTAFVNLGAPGSYQLRVVGDAGGPTSDSFLVTVR
jgi:hypothetical protein